MFSVFFICGQHKNSFIPTGHQSFLPLFTALLLVCLNQLTTKSLQKCETQDSVCHLRSFDRLKLPGQDLSFFHSSNPYQSSGLTASGSGILGLSSQSSGFWSFGSSISRGGFTGGDISFSKFPLLTTIWSTRISKLLSGFKTGKKKKIQPLHRRYKVCFQVSLIPAVQFELH